MKGNSVALTALGMVNALGNDTREIWKRVLDQDQSGLTFQKGYLNGRSVRVGKVLGKMPIFPRRLKRYACRNNALAFMAYGQIEPASQRALGQYGAHRLGVVVGSSTSGLAASESAFAKRVSNGKWPRGYDYVQHEMGGLAEFLADLVGIEGPAYTLSTACSSSAKVLASARALIRDGWCDAVLVGGADSLCRLTVQGFTALEALSSKPCNSMSRNRDGFTIGEGAALFLMERAEAGKIRLLGVGESSDAHHISAPHPEGLGAYAAMWAAIKESGLRAKDISYVHLHGTGTLLNDQMESRAVSRLLPKVPASSTKGLVGHTLGASGAMGVGICWLALQNAKLASIDLPPHSWDGRRDPQLPVMHLVKAGQTIKKKKQTAFLCNSFGFGGSNCSIIIG